MQINEFDGEKNKSDNSPIERARKSPNLSTTQMSHSATKLSHGVTNPFIGAFHYRGTLKNSDLRIPQHLNNLFYHRGISQSFPQVASCIKCVANCK